MDKNVKFTNENKILSKKIEQLMKEKNLTVIQLAEKAEISRQGVYNILNGTIPRKSTLDLIAQALGVTSKSLLDDIRYFQYEYFRQKLNARFPCEINKESYEAYIADYDVELEDPYSISVEEYLVYKFDVDPVELFVKHILPEKETQHKIAEHFGYKPEEIFVPQKSIKGDLVGQQDRLLVRSTEALNNEKFQAIFDALNLKNKKIVYNLSLDLLQTQK